MTGTLKPLHDYQADAMLMLRQSLSNGHKRPILQMPTGSGKTILAVHMAAGALEKRKRLTFVVPAIGLVDQTFERFTENGIDPLLIGVIQVDHPWRRPTAPIQISTAQRLARRDRPETDFVVIDEAHLRHKAVEEWMDEQPDMYFIGLTATPWSQGLGQRYDDLLKPITTRDLIDLGRLSKFRVFAPSHPDLSKVRTQAGDYHETDLADVMSKDELVADIVTTWLAKGNNQPTLCFAVNRSHAKALRDRFDDAGVPVEYIDAFTPREERDAIGQRLAAGEVKVVCNIGTLTTGIDWDVRCLILARPTKSESLFVQIIGRALRTAPGKDHAIILDHSDTHLRLGMVTDIDQDELCTGKSKRATAEAKERNTPLPKECLNCTGLIPPGVSNCYSCGAPVPKQQFSESDGELQEFGVETKSGNSQSIGDAIRAMGKQAVYSQLCSIQREKQRSKGWVANTYRDIFGVWPRSLRDDWLDASPIVRSYCKHKDIKFAKSRANR